MHNASKWTSVLLLCSFAGCMLGPDYERPEQEMPEDFRRSDAVQTQDAQSECLAYRNWREIYQDQELQRLISIGLENNLDIRVALSRIRESRFRFVATRSALFPQLGLFGGFERERESSITNTSPGPETEIFLWGLLSWEIDLWGAIRRSTEAASAEWIGAHMAREELAVSLIGEIAIAYFELLDIDTRLEISGRTVATRAEAVEVAKIRKQGGVISELEVRQAEVEHAAAESTLPDLRRRRLIKENQLSFLLGRPPGEIERGLVLDEQPLPPAVPVGLPSSLLQRRPDVRQSEQKLIAANARIGRAKAEFFPRLVLTAAYGRESDSLSTLLNSSGEAWVLGGDLAMPIFTAGRTRAQLAIAREQYEQARLSYRKVVLRALQEVSDALESYHQANEQVAVQQNLVESSREYVRLAKLKYFGGVLSYLDLLDAQRRLFEGEVSLSEANRNRLVALVLLYKALGGGWGAETEQEIAQRAGVA